MDPRTEERVSLLGSLNDDEVHTKVQISFIVEFRQPKSINHFTKQYYFECTVLTSHLIFIWMIKQSEF